jgi:hypothetical protein
VVTISLVVWPIAFNLGAFDQVFYTDVFRFVVAATAGLAVSVLANPYAGQRRWRTHVILAAPAGWLFLAAVLTTSTAEAATNPILGPLALLIVVVSIPTVLRMMTDMFVPGFRSYTSRRLLIGGMAVVIAIGVAGYVVGANNNVFLTCDDFKIAGSDQPTNCSPG